MIDIKDLINADNLECIKDLNSLTVGKVYPIVSTEVTKRDLISVVFEDDDGDRRVWKESAANEFFKVVQKQTLDLSGAAVGDEYVNGNDNVVKLLFISNCQYVFETQDGSLSVHLDCGKCIALGMCVFLWVI